MRIFVQSWLTNDEKDFLANNIKNHHQVVFANELPSEARKDAAYNSQIIFGNIPPDYIPHCHHLQWLQLDSTGVNSYLDCSFSPTCQITHLKGFYAKPVAETAVAGILALYRKVDDLVKLKEEKRWNYKEIRPALRLLHNKQVLIIGGGAIGLEIKKLLEAFDCKITVFSRSKPPADINEIEKLGEAMAFADIVIGCLPQTPATINLINHEKLAKLQPEAVFVNVGRGSAIDEKYLIQMLKENKIEGAVIDVTQKEPLPDNHPWWDCPNTILTQHTSGGFINEGKQKVQIFLDNLHRFEKNESLDGLVNFEKGY
mgnify:CR=1 FL=1